MVRVWKEVLCVGRHRDASGRWHEFTRRDIQHALTNARTMLSRGLSIPAIWEHQPIEVGDRPRTSAEIAEWKRNYARNCFGHIADARINGRGNLDLLHEVPDSQDAERLRKVRFASPKVYPSYSDQRGGEYRGTTIAHVAATPTPVQFWQRPFELSRSEALYLSYTMPDEDKDKKKKDGEGEGGSELSKLIEALKDHGMTIPEEVKDLSGLIIAVKSCKKGDYDDTGADDLDLDTDKADDLDLDKGATAGAGGPPMMMSTTDADPGRRSQATAWARDERRDVKARIEALFASGRIDRPTARQLWRQAKAVEMSFTKDAEAVSPVHAKLATLEKTKANSAWDAKGRKGQDLSITRTVDAPKGLKGDTAEGTKEATDFLLARIPGPAPATATK